MCVGENKQRIYPGPRQQVLTFTNIRLAGKFCETIYELYGGSLPQVMRIS